MHRSIAILALVCLAVGPLAAYLGILPPLAGLGIFSLSGVLGLVAMVWGVVIWLRRKQRRGVISALLGVIPVIVLLIPIAGAAGYPRINDITTDPADPPALPMAPSYPEAFKAIAAQAYHDVRPLVLHAQPRDVFAEALALGRAQGWEIASVDEQGMMFTAVATTRLFRFQDDIAVRVRAAQNGEAVVDMRSRSRQGQGDQGANATRIRVFLRNLEKRVGSAPK